MTATLVPGTTVQARAYVGMVTAFIGNDPDKDA